MVYFSDFQNYKRIICNQSSVNLTVKKIKQAKTYETDEVKKLSLLLT